MKPKKIEPKTITELEKEMEVCKIHAEIAKHTNNPITELISEWAAVECDIRLNTLKNLNKK